MIDYSYKNNLKFGYGGQWFNERPDINTSIVYSMDRCDRKPGTPQEEFHNIARMLAEKAGSLGRTPYVLLSGGMDSEVVCKSFIDQNIDFNAITFRFDNDGNGHETELALKFAQRHNLNFEFYDIDILSFLESEEAENLFISNHCNAAIMLPHMKTVSHVWDNLNGMPIIGGGDIVVQKFGNQWHFCKLEYMLPWYWHMRKNDIDGGVAFFHHIPEATLAMLKESLIEDIALCRKQTDAADVRQAKYEVYQKYWPDLESRPKYGGYERLIEPFAVASYKMRLKQKLQYAQVWAMPYSEFCKSIEPL